MEFIVYHYAYALLTLTKAKSSAKLYFISELILRDETLKLFYDKTRTLDVTGASDTNCDFKHNILPL
jgi:hypothetical protein